MTAFAIALFALAQAPATEIDGSYDLRSLVEDGKEYAARDKVGFQEVTLANGELTIRSIAGADVARFTLDPKAKIPQIDFASPQAGDKTMSPGIYKFEKGELTIVYRKGGGARPLDFKGSEKDLVKLVLVKRQPKK